VVVYFRELRLEEWEAWLDFLEVRGRLELLLPLALVRRDLADDEGALLLWVWVEEDVLRDVAEERPAATWAWLGRLRKNERRKKGCLAVGFRGGRPALVRETSRSLRSASSFFLWTRTTAACFISLMPR
jgi:hypothetical protein